MSEIKEFKGNFYKGMVLDESGELPARVYNLIIGGMLAYGFFVCYALLALFPMPRYMLMRQIYRSQNSGQSLLLLWIGYFVLTLGGSFLVRSRKPLLAFLGFNLIAVPVGLLASVTLGLFGSDIVTRAVLITGVIVVLMLAVSMIVPDFFEGMGRTLGFTLLLTLIAELVCALVFHTSTEWTDYIVIGIMTLYIGFDWVRANRVPRTVGNAMCAAANLYLDIINILLRVARILAKSKSKD